MIKKHWQKLVIVLVALAILIPVSLAQTSVAPLTKDKNPLACAANADLKFKDFLSSVISYDGFTEAFEDVIFTNSCQQYDIDNKINQLSKVREQIRKSFYNCDDKRANALSQTYNDALTELYYIRHSVTSDPFDASGSSFNKYDASLEGDLYFDMKERFVDDKAYYTDSEFDLLYENLQASYKNRRKEYLSCNDFVVTDLIEKWNEFTETAGGFKKGAEKAQKKINRGIKRLESTPPKATGNLLWGFLDARTNGIDPLSGISQIYDETKKDLPFADLPESQGLVFDSYIGEISAYQEELTQAKFLARYDLLYKNTTDSIRESFENKLKETNTTVKETFPTLNNLNGCISAISLRQCKSKE